MIFHFQDFPRILIWTRKYDQANGHFDTRLHMEDNLTLDNRQIDQDDETIDLRQKSHDREHFDSRQQTEDNHKRHENKRQNTISFLCKKPTHLKLEPKFINLFVLLLTISLLPTTNSRCIT